MTTVIRRSKAAPTPKIDPNGIRWERIHYYPRGQTDIQSCEVYKGTSADGKVRYRILVHTMYPGSYAWPVDVAFTSNRQQNFGTLRSIEFGIATRDAPRDIEWRPLGQFPEFNESHRQDGVFRKPDYCIMTKDWIPVPRS